LLREAERFFASFPSATQLRSAMKEKDYLRFRRRAERQLKTRFDLPPEFSARARSGLLGSLILAAAQEERLGEANSDQRVASFHALLIREN
jgi:hypothetical protein